MLSQISCTQLKGVGIKTAEALERIHIYTIQDLLFHLPVRYQNRAEKISINRLQIGDLTTVAGTLKQSTHC